MAKRFVIPRPYSTGLAIPANVRAEGLQRGAYVTKWAPRGTYDDSVNPRSPTWDSSYAVPQYIRSEGYGQGARVTHWAPPGTYVGSVKQQVAKAMGDVDAPMPTPFVRYGQRAARAIILRIQNVAPTERRAKLKALLDAIDPSLFTRTDRLAQQLIQRGVPPVQAIEQGLARSMATGVASEILELGATRKKPSARSLLGLGAYGGRWVASALGDTVASKAGLNMTTVLAQAAATGTPQREGYCWIPATDAVPGHWERARAGVPCAALPPGSGPTSGGSQGGVTVTDTTTGQQVKTPVQTAPATSVDFLRVGPWLLRNEEGSKIGIAYSLLTKDQVAQLWKGIQTVLAQAMALGFNGQRVYNIPYGPHANGPNLKDLGLPIDMKVDKIVMNTAFPIAKFKHPTTGDNEQLMVVLQDGKLQVFWHKWESIWEKIVGFLVELVASIVKPILEELGDLACQLLNDPAAAAGTQIAAGASGVPPGAAATGVQAGKTICGGQQQTLPPEADSFPILPVVIAGGAVLAIAAFWPKKKRHA